MGCSVATTMPAAPLPCAKECAPGKNAPYSPTNSCTPCAGDLRRAAAFYPDNLPALAYELDVTEELLVIYLDAHPLTVAQA